MKWLVLFFILSGAVFSLIAALGVLRFPDFFMRMHAATKAGAFGAALMLIAAAIHFGTPRAIITAVAIIVFFYLTAPVAAQALSEAAYRCGVKFWSKTGEDKLAKSGEIRKGEDEISVRPSND